MKELRQITGGELNYTGQWADRMFTLTQCDECRDEIPLYLESGDHVEDIKCPECHPDDEWVSIPKLKKVGTGEILCTPVVEAYCDNCEQTLPIPLEVWEDNMPCVGCCRDDEEFRRWVGEVYIPAINRYLNAHPGAFVKALKAAGVPEQEWVNWMPQ